MENSKVIAAESGHWYMPDGQPCYEVENKSKPGTMRPTTLRDAKKLGLVPSVTSVLSILAKPGLEVWKQNQILLAAATSPHKRSGMSADEWAGKVISDAQAQAEQARQKGTEIHAAIEKYLRAGSVEQEYQEYVIPLVREMLRLGMMQGARVEHSFAHPQGFGGKIDFYSDTVLVDFKTKEFTDISKPLAWDEHLYQLSGYRYGVQAPYLDCYNVFISTNKPGLFYFKKWDNEEVKHGVNVFTLALDLWKAIKL